MPQVTLSLAFSVGEKVFHPGLKTYFTVKGFVSDGSQVLAYLSETGEFMSEDVLTYDELERCEACFGLSFHSGKCHLCGWSPAESEWLEPTLSAAERNGCQPHARPRW